MPSPHRKNTKTRKRLSKSPASKSPDSHNSKVNKKRERELVERANVDSSVRKQLIELMEEDQELIDTYYRHLERRFKGEWNNFSDKEKAELIKKSLFSNRIPISNKGGKRTKRRLKKNKRITRRRK